MVSQPSLSYSIKVLEEQIGVKLFRKDKNRVYLTEEGRKIYEKLTVIFDLLEDVNPNNDDVSGKIILGLRTAFADDAWPVYMRTLNLLYPHLQIDYIPGESDTLKKLLLSSLIGSITILAMFIELDSFSLFIVFQKFKKRIVN